MVLWPDGFGVGVVEPVGLEMGDVVGLLVGATELRLAVGVGLGDELAVLLGVDVAGELLVGASLVDAEPEADELPAGAGLPVGVASAEPEALGDPVRVRTESSRIAAFGRVEQAPFTIGGLELGEVITEATTSGLEARSRKPVNAPNAAGLASRALIGTASSGKSVPAADCPPWSSQYALPD